jgi:DNA-binding transcriptional regulator YhcF (GntR family)
LRLSRPRMGKEGQRIVSPPPLQRELADRISTQREVVTRELASLARKGIIEKTRGGLVLLEPDRLHGLIAEAHEQVAQAPAASVQVAVNVLGEVAFEHQFIVQVCLDARSQMKLRA